MRIRRIAERLRALPSERRRTLVRASVLLFGVRTALRLFPFATVRRLVARLARSNGERAPAPDPETVGWAVEAAGRRLLSHHPCLPQALTAQLMLARAGHPSRLRIGVARRHGERLEAHAWVECGGRIVVGHLPEHDAYTPLPDLDHPEGAPT